MPTLSEPPSGRRNDGTAHCSIWQSIMSIGERRSVAHEVTPLLLELAERVDRVGELAPDLLAEERSRPVEVVPHRRLRHPVARGELAVGRTFLDRSEVVLGEELPLEGLRAMGEALLERREGSLRHLGDELPIEGRLGLVVRVLGLGGALEARRLAPHAPPLGPAVVAGEVPEEALQVVPEAPALRGVLLEHVAAEEPDEELLRDVVGLVVVLGPGRPRVVADRAPVAARELLHLPAVTLGPRLERSEDA